MIDTNLITAEMFDEMSCAGEVIPLSAFVGSLSQYPFTNAAPLDVQVACHAVAAAKLRASLIANAYDTLEWSGSKGAIAIRDKMVAGYKAL